ncbi:MAG: hypothetical protein QXY32_08560 [Nitrososphaerota archaeon]
MGLPRLWRPAGPHPTCLKNGIPWATIFFAPRGVGAGATMIPRAGGPWGVVCLGADHSPSPPGCGLGPPAYPGVRLGAYPLGEDPPRRMPGCIS